MSSTNFLLLPSVSDKVKVKIKMWAQKKVAKSRSPRVTFSLGLYFPLHREPNRVLGSRFMAQLSSLREKAQGFGATSAVSISSSPSLVGRSWSFLSLSHE